MTYRSPKPASTVTNIAGTAMRSMTSSTDWVEQNRDAVDELLAGDSSRLTERWIGLIGQTSKASDKPIWTYWVTPVDLTIPRSSTGVVNGTATGTDTTDLTMAGKGYNLRELLNTSTTADGYDISALPGTFAVKPISGFVECWHQRLKNGDVVIMFDVRNPIDGTC
jgi:hypothetical protein